MRRKQVKVLGLTLLVLLSVGAYAATTYQPYTAGSTLQTDSGLSVTLQDDSQIESGNPFDSSDAVTLRGIQFESAGTSEVTLADNSTAWTNITSIGAAQNQVTIRPAHKPLVRVEGGIQSVKLTDDVSVSNDGRTELIIDASSSGNLTVDTNGQGAVAVDAQSGASIDEGQVQPDGTVRFQIPSGTHRIDLQSAPSTLFVFKESSPSELISGSAELRIRFFTEGTEEVIEKTVTDGTADLSEIPSDQRFVVTVKASNSDYAYRRIVVDSLSEQQDVYLLNTANTSNVEVEFGLTDYTGAYPSSETTLYIEKPITKDFDNDGDDETRYRTILGDNFGSTGQFPARLAENERYRLRLVNGPNQRVLGAYTASRSEVEPITIQNINLESQKLDTFVTTTSTATANGQRSLTIRFLDNSTSTSQLSVDVYERNNPNNTVYSDTVTNAPIQNYSVYNIPIQNDTSYVVDWSIERDGDTLTRTQLIGGGGFTLDIPLDSDWLGTFGFMFIAFLAALAGRETHHIIGVTVVSMAGILMWLQAVAISPPLWWIAALIAGGGYLAEKQKGGL
ncbi:G protein-coupled receptor family protein [Haloarcula sp. H-GB5]